jgi:23S rRNA (adenine2030-N6)-methyltransferase
MNYQHLYHAGNWVDVIKHLFLIALIKKMQQKEKPLMVSDGFAGLGIYDLKHPKSLKTSEAIDGINKFYQAFSSRDYSYYQRYIDIIKFFNPKNLQYYPGSPLFILKLLRAKDQAIFYELRKEDFYNLNDNLQNYPNKIIKNYNGYELPKKSLPSKLDRGLLFFDPCFEQKDEFIQLANSLECYKKRAGHFLSLVWYPIKNTALIENFYSQVRAMNFSEVLIIEVTRHNCFHSLIHFGLMIVNPPQISSDIDAILSPLKELWDLEYKISTI